jgi:WhiB family transcriptional regulator, redox-sensing transcriptional regulator
VNASAAPVGRMSPFTVLTREQRVKSTTDRKTPAPADLSWKAAAECAKPGYDPGLWYPDGNAGPWMLRIQDAKDVCNFRCPVRDACAAYAMANGEPHGIWGGMTEADRAGVRRRASRVAENRRKREREAANA